MAPMLSEKQSNVLTPVNPQTQAQQTVVWSKPSVQLPKVLHGLEQYDGAPLRLKHTVPSPGQRRFLLRMECGSSDELHVNISSPFAKAEDNIARLTRGTRLVTLTRPQHVGVEDVGAVPWVDLFQADNDKLHASYVVPKFDDMVWSSGSFTPTSRTLSETDKFAYQRSSEESAASTGSRSLDARCFGNVFEQFAQSSLAVEPDDEDAEDGDALWDSIASANGHVSPTLKFQRTSASWRPRHNTDSFSESQSSTTGTNAIALYTDDECSLSSGASAFSSRVASARSLFAPQPHRALSHDSDSDFRQQQHTDALPGSEFREPPDRNQANAHRAPAVVKRSNLLPIRSSLAPLQCRTSPRRRFAAARAYMYGQGPSSRPKQDMTQKDGSHCSKTFRKLAVSAATLNDAELDKQLIDSGLGDGLQSARRHAEGNAKRKAPAINLTIRLSNDYASLKALGCSEAMLSQLHSIDPPKEEVEIVAEKVETGDMTLLCAPPEARLQPIPARCFAPNRRQSSPSESSYPQLSRTSVDLAIPSLLKQRPAQRAASGSSPLPSHADWIMEARSSPLRFSAMTSPVPRFQEAMQAPVQDASKAGVTDWANALQESSYSYHSVFSGPPRFPEVRRDIVTPPNPLHAAAQLHNRRSCTAQHKQEREPTSMLESRISAALAKEAQAPTTTERMGLRSVQERAAALEVDMIGSHYGAKDHERIKTKQERLMQLVASQTNWNALTAHASWQEMFQERERQPKVPPFML